MKPQALLSLFFAVGCFRMNRMAPSSIAGVFQLNYGMMYGEKSEARGENDYAFSIGYREYKYRARRL